MLKPIVISSSLPASPVDVVIALDLPADEVRAIRIGGFENMYELEQNYDEAEYIQILHFAAHSYNICFVSWGVNIAS
ncbi:MAG: hypothetical protein WBZ36_21085 [Candidatus Nitrosopolaris sp.]|jgi:hypothetical protein